MASRTPKELSERLKFHSDNSLELFKEARLLFESAMNLPYSKKQIRMFEKVTKINNRAISEKQKIIKLSERFISNIRRKAKL